MSFATDWLWWVAYAACGLCALFSSVIVHELGHWVVSRALAIKVTEVSADGGPVLFAICRGETRYRFSVFAVRGQNVLLQYPERHETGEYVDFGVRAIDYRTLMFVSGQIATALVGVVLLLIAKGPSALQLLSGSGWPHVARLSASIAPAERIELMNAQASNVWNALVAGAPGGLGTFVYIAGLTYLFNTAISVSVFPNSDHEHIALTGAEVLANRALQGRLLRLFRATLIYLWFVATLMAARVLF